MSRERMCPVCNGDRKETIYTTPTKQKIQACLNCGMVFSEGLPDVDYAADSIYSCAGTYDSQPEHYRIIVANILYGQWVNTSSSVCDVGCALGGLMDAFHCKGFADVSGVSLSRAEVEHCLGKGFQSRVCDVADADHGEYDLITLSHVLEHVPDVQKFLHNLRYWVKDEGSLYIEVPNAMKYADCFTSICQGFNSEHINHFNSGMLRMACERAGWYVGSSGEYLVPKEDGSFYPVTWAVFRKYRHDSKLRHSVSQYAETLDGQLARVKEHLNKELAGVDWYYVWGMGQTTKMLVADGTIDIKRVMFGTDTNPVYCGKNVYGIPVFSSGVFCSTVKTKPDRPILVCSQSKRSEIVGRIRELGLTNRIISLEE